MKRFTLILLLLMVVQLAMSQTTVTITVKKDNSAGALVAGASVTISNATYLPGGMTATTDASGVATFNIPTQTAYYYLTAVTTNTGYYTTTNQYLYVAANGTSATSTEYLKFLYDVNFLITDEADVPITTANVSITSAYPTTENKNVDGTGAATFKRTYNTNQSVTVTAPGYADSTKTFSVPANGTNPVVVPTIKMKNAYPVTFTVKDGSSNPVNGAKIVLTGFGISTTLTTDASGVASFTKKKNATYSYIITATGFIDYYGSVTVAGSDPAPAVTLTAGYDLSFTIINGSQASGSTTGLQQDTITIDGHTKITSATSNVLTFGVAPGSSYTFDNKKAGFITVPVNTGTINANTPITIYMEPVYAETFTIYDGSYAPLAGAEVTFNGTTVTTLADGKAKFTNITASATPYPYSVTPPNGTIWKPVSGTITCGLISTNYLYNKNNNLTSSIYLESPKVTFMLSTGSSAMPVDYRKSATITFNGTDKAWDWNMYTTFNAGAGIYNYTITPTAEPTKAIIYGRTSITNDINQSIRVFIVDGKTISFDVFDEGGSSIDGVSVTLDGITQLTDASGYSGFTRKAVNTTYIARFEKTGYATLLDTINLVDVDILDKIITLKAAQNITFNVVDAFDAPISGAVVTCAYNTATTDASGNAVISAADGTYDYKVSADGYAIYKGTVTVSGASVTQNIKLTTTGYALKFTVQGPTGYALPEAKIKVTNATESIDETFLTDINGIVQTKKVFKSAVELAYKVTANGYRDSISTTTLADADAVIAPIKLFQSKDVVFKVSHLVNGAIANAKIEIDGKTFFTDAAGQVVIPQLIYGAHSYVVTATGYEKYTATYTVNSNSISVPVTLTISKSDVTFAVTDGTNPLVGVEVIFNANTVDADTVLTNVDGKVIYSAYLNGNYDYKISFAGYETVTGTATVLDADQTVNITLNKYYTITFNVTDGTTAITGANVTIGSTTLTTDASGQVIFSSMINGTYDYSVAATTYTNATGTVTVNDADATQNITMSLTTYSITFNVTDGTNAIAGADVTINATTVTTDAGGQAVFTNMPPASYSYSVAKTSYNTVSGSVDVTNADVAKDVTMDLTKYSITFNVTDGTNAIAGADVTINSTTVTTDASGNALFANMVPATYSYSVAKATYNTVTGSVDVTNADVTKNVTMDLSKYSITFNVTDGTNAIAGADVTINSTTVTTDAGGHAVFTNMLPANYSYSVAKATYNNVTGSVTVTNADVAEPVTMVLTKYSITFTVTNGTSAIVGASVTINSNTVTTDASGHAVFSNMLPATYNYSVTATSYYSTSGSVTVSSADVNQPVTLLSTGINEDKEISVNAYPNPTKGIIYIAIPQGFDENVTVSVTNIIGAQLSELKFSNSTEKVMIDLSGYNNGIYFIQVRRLGLNKTIRVVKN